MEMKAGGAYDPMTTIWGRSMGLDTPMVVNTSCSLFTVAIRASIDAILVLKKTHKKKNTQNENDCNHDYNITKMIIITRIITWD